MLKALTLVVTNKIEMIIVFDKYLQSRCIFLISTINTVLEIKKWTK